MNPQIKKQIEQEALRIYPKDEGLDSKGVIFDLDGAYRITWIEGAEYGYNIKESVNEKLLMAIKRRNKNH